MKASLAGLPGTHLLLGVTPELTEIASPLVAVDWSAEMIARIWPGDGVHRRAVMADWFAMPFAHSSFATACGDGVFNMLLWPDPCVQLIDRLRDVVRPGGRIVMRCFTAPEIPETLAELSDHVWSGSPPGFDAFKWRLAAAAAAQAGSANIAMRKVWEAFEQMFPDRVLLSQATGWSPASIEQIDGYAISHHVKCFPTLSAIKSAFSEARTESSGDYELAERCPLFVLDV